MNGSLKHLEPVLDEIFAEAGKETGGEAASYIPELAKVDPDLFAISICDMDGNLIEHGDSEYEFTIQSISKVLSYACALDLYDSEAIDRRVDVEPTGEDFDSIIKLDRHKRPFNPMVNAGAIAITDLLLSHFKKGALDGTLSYFAELLGKDKVEVDEAVFKSEQNTGDRNRSTAHLLKHFSLLDNPVEEVLDLYYRHCSVRVTTRDIARLGARLASRGAAGGFRKTETPRNVLSVMLTCGMYNYAGQWAFEIGYPAKCGISGGLLGVVPDGIGIGVFSPRVDEHGSSLRGVVVNRLLSQKLNLHTFAYPPRKLPF